MHAALAIQPPLALRRRWLRLAAWASAADATPTEFNRYLLSVDFHTLDGKEWSSVGGGDSIEEAIASARDALPFGADWSVARWNELYGD